MGLSNPVCFSCTFHHPACSYPPVGKDEEGNVQIEFASKEHQTCWEVHHNGELFEGPRQPFGRLVYFRPSAEQHPMMPNTVPGIFLGWRLESALRYRHVLYVADYETVRQEGFKRKSVRSIQAKEVHFL